MVHDRIRALRERLERSKQSAKGKARARDRSRKRGAKARKKAEKQRRLERGNPKNVREHARVSGRETAKAASEAKGAFDAGTTFVSQELGVKKQHAEGVIESGNELFQKAKSAGVPLQQFDIDGDGDTDLLQVLDAPGGGGQGGSGAVVDPSEPIIDPTEPAIDVPGTIAEPLFNEAAGGAVDAHLVSPGSSSPGDSAPLSSGLDDDLDATDPVMDMEADLDVGIGLDDDDPGLF